METISQAKAAMQLVDPGIRAALRRKLETMDRRRHRRVPFDTRVRGLAPQGREFEARTIDVGAGGMSMHISVSVQIGDPLILYLDGIGRVEGTVIRAGEGTCAVELRAPSRKRDKIADQLTWLLNRERLNLEDDRVAERRQASGGQVVAIGANGVAIACTVLDMSIFGVALRSNGPRPMLGDRVRLGERTGTCVRYFDGGFALDFRTVEAD